MTSFLFNASHREQSPAENKTEFCVRNTETSIVREARPVSGCLLNCRAGYIDNSSSRESERERKDGDLRPVNSVGELEPRHRATPQRI